MTFDPEQNRVPTGLLTADERAALEGAKYGWQKYRYGNWKDVGSPVWFQEDIYRAKPAPAPTIIVNGIEVPEPVWEALEVGQGYWVADVITTELSLSIRWYGDKNDRERLDRGLIHLTESAAIAHAKAMLAPSMRGMCDDTGQHGRR